MMNSNFKSAVDCAVWGAVFVLVGLVLPTLVFWVLYRLALVSVVPTAYYFASLEGFGLVVSVLVGFSRAQIKYNLGMLADYVAELILLWDRFVHRNNQELVLPVYILSFYVLGALTLLALYVLFSLIGAVGNSVVGLLF